MMNSIPNFDMKNPREYPTYEGAPIAKDNVSTGQRIIQSFSPKVIFWAALTILVIWAFFENPLVSSVSRNLMWDWLLFAGGLMLGVLEGVVQQKHRAANQAPVWLRIVVAIATLTAAFALVYFLGSNHFVISLFAGGVAGSGAWWAISAYRSNWAAYS